MMHPPPPAPLTLDDLYAHFPTFTDRPAVRAVPADALPAPYHDLLAHTHHMTVTVERFYGEPVDVRVLEVARAGTLYARKILLHTRHTRKPVQFGIVTVELSYLAAEVAAEIVGGRTPLGRVLITHDVLRTVRPVGFFRAGLGPTMRDWFGLAEEKETFGRLGVITADGRPTVRVAEILAPVG